MVNNLAEFKICFKHSPEIPYVMTREKHLNNEVTNDTLKSVFIRIEICSCFT